MQSVWLLVEMVPGLHLMAFGECFAGGADTSQLATNTVFLV